MASSNSKGPVSLEGQTFEPPQVDAGRSKGFKTEETSKGLNREISSVTAAYSAARRTQKSPWWQSQFKLMLMVFALLGLAALLFIAIAPAPDVEQLQAKISSNESKTKPEEAPYSKGQLAADRESSQEVLSELLANQKKLEALDVNAWAKEEYLAGLELAKQGDEYYKQQEFAQAQDNYRLANTAMLRMLEALPQRIRAELGAGHIALDQGKPDLAREKFLRALKFDANNLEAKQGLDRANNLNEVLELVSVAQTEMSKYEQSADLNDLNSALSKLEKAHEIDPEYKAIDAALIKVRSDINDHQFKEAMSKAYQALFSSNYQTARSQFAQALALKPNDSLAASGMQQSLASNQSASIDSMLRAAKQFEQNEEWVSAVGNYKSILQRDPNQVEAKLGNIRSGARLKLDTDLEAVLLDPLALSQARKRQTAEQVLTDAKAIRVKGARLNDQISRLDAALLKLDKPIKVQLSSDGLTLVKLRKQGSKAVELGTFSSKNLSLKPGRYTATGQRLGYQDVRLDIELKPAGKTASFDVRCVQALNIGSR